MSTLDEFANDLYVLNQRYDEVGVNLPSRTLQMLQQALINLDAFKITHHPSCSALTEKEFLEQAKRAYWKTREQLQSAPKGDGRDLG